MNWRHIQACRWIDVRSDFSHISSGTRFGNANAGWQWQVSALCYLPSAIRKEIRKLDLNDESSPTIPSSRSWGLNFRYQSRCLRMRSCNASLGSSQHPQLESDIQKQCTDRSRRSCARFQRRRHTGVFPNCRTLCKTSMNNQFGLDDSTHCLTPNHVGFSTPHQSKRIGLCTSSRLCQGFFLLGNKQPETGREREPTSTFQLDRRFRTDLLTMDSPIVYLTRDLIY